VGALGLDVSGSGQRQMSGWCARCVEPSGSVRGDEFLTEKLSDFEDGLRSLQFIC
jgi:hypothetical protein